MVSVPDHKSHHDDPEELSLLTESAEVVDITAVDHNRVDELRHEGARVLRELDRDDLVADPNHPHLDWDGIDTFLEDADDDPLTTELSYLHDRYERAYPSLLTIGIHEEEEAIDFVPGQYVTIRFHNTPRPYSLASSPNDDALELCLRRVPGGRLTSDLFETLSPGDEVVVRGPNGEFITKDPSTRDMAFLATGTGVAPLRSMIRYTFQENRDVHDGETRDIWLFIGSSWKDDVPYREEFRNLADTHDNFHFVPTLSREPYLTDWDGETAYVQQTFMQYLADDVDADVSDDLAAFLGEQPATDIDARIHPEDLEVYACGVSAMVQTLVDAAQQVGVPESNIRGEGYG